MLNLWPNFSFVQIDSDKTIMVTLKHDDKLQDGSECAFQVCGKLTAVIPRVCDVQLTLYHSWRIVSYYG